MKALTLWRPWAWPIVAGHKPIENRGWLPPRSIIGKRIAIHAGKSVQQEAISEIQLLIGDRLPDCAMDMGIVGTVIISGCVTQSASPWFCGPFGWSLSSPVMLPAAIPCSGAQGFWEVPPDVLSQILATHGAME